jgi:hypothetical protein
MRLEIGEIKEIKVVSCNVDNEFAYIDKLNDGTWRIVYSKNLEGRIVIHERTPMVNFDEKASRIGVNSEK